MPLNFPSFNLQNLTLLIDFSPIRSLYHQVDSKIDSCSSSYFFTVSCPTQKGVNGWSGQVKGRRRSSKLNSLDSQAQNPILIKFIQENQKLETRLRASERKVWEY